MSLLSFDGDYYVTDQKKSSSIPLGALKTWSFEHRLKRRLKSARQNLHRALSQLSLKVSRVIPRRYRTSRIRRLDTRTRRTKRRHRSSICSRHRIAHTRNLPLRRRPPLRCILTQQWIDNTTHLTLSQRFRRRHSHKTRTDIRRTKHRRLHSRCIQCRIVRTGTASLPRRSRRLPCLAP